MNTPSNSNLCVWLGLACSKSSVIPNDIRYFVCNMKLVRVWIWLLGSSKFVDCSRSDLKVLLQIGQLASRVGNVYKIYRHSESTPSHLVHPRQSSSSPASVVQLLPFLPVCSKLLAYPFSAVVYLSSSFRLPRI